MKIINIKKESGIPLIGNLAFGIVDRGSNLLQVRCTSSCNMKCTFCSTSANDYDKHPNNFIVDIPYLVEELKKIVKIKGDNITIFLDSVGEPTTHPDFISLVEEINKIKEVREIILITNGTLLTEKKIDKLEKAGLNRINLSFHALDSTMAKKLFGNDSYNVNQIIKLIKYISKSKIELMLTPVLISNINQEEIIKIIKLAKETNCKIGIQNYEAHKLGRKMKGAKRESYYKFYEKLKQLEKEHNVKLVYSPKDLNILHVPKLERPMEIGKKLNIPIIEEGWFKNQRITSYRDRSITVNNCSSSPGDRINLKIIENKNNIYLAEKV